MNPFNQTRYRGEHELGNAYKDVRTLVENLEHIKLLADNIRNLRSGNIELSSEGSVLKWKYVNDTEWFDLVDLAVLTESLDNSVSVINNTLQNINLQLDTINGSLNNQSTDIGNLDQRVGAVEAFDSRISQMETTILSLTSRIETLENAGGA